MVSDAETLEKLTPAAKIYFSCHTAVSQLSNKIQEVKNMKQKTNEELLALN